LAGMLQGLSRGRLGGPKMKLGTRDRLAHIETEARRLARSGEHRGFKSIEIVLLSRGYREARRIFANRWTCSELERICEQSLANRNKTAA
jgi:hypothetical protein